METPRVVFLTLVFGASAGGAGAGSGGEAGSGSGHHPTVQEVVLDLIVRDARGREVRNLKPSDVTKKLSARDRDPGGLRFDPRQQRLRYAWPGGLSTFGQEGIG